MLTLAVIEVTKPQTEHQTWPKKQKQHKKLFFAQREKPGRSPPQEL